MVVALLATPGKTTKICVFLFVGPQGSTLHFLGLPTCWATSAEQASQVETEAGLAAVKDIAKVDGVGLGRAGLRLGNCLT